MPCFTEEREISVRADEPVNPLSTIKMAVMLGAYRDVDERLFDLDERYRLGPADRRAGSGLRQTFAPGL